MGSILHPPSPCRATVSPGPDTPHQPDPRGQGHGDGGTGMGLGPGICWKDGSSYSRREIPAAPKARARNCRNCGFGVSGEKGREGAHAVPQRESCLS